MKVRTLLLAVTALLLPLAAACSDDSDDSDNTTTTEAEETTTTEAEETTTTADGANGPTDAEVSTQLQLAFQVDPEIGNCAAAELRGTVSAEALAGIASGEYDNLPQEEVTQVENAIRDAFAACS